MFIKKHISIVIPLLILNISILSAKDFKISDQRLGDPAINYVNPEISPVGNYMVWIEIDTINGFSGKVWHCGLDPDTGDLIPENGKGFNPFTSNVYGRPADWGVDAIGPYYVGLNSSGQFVFVRPTGPTSADVEILPTAPDLKRRVIYPSQLPNSDKKFITFILNENQPGGANNPANSIFELRFLDLDNPTNEMIIETQTRSFPAAVGMDVLVPRWIKGTPYLTYGFYDNENFVQVKEFDAFNPEMPPIAITNDQNIKADGYPVNNPFNNRQYLVSGLNGTETAIVYRREHPGELFTQIETILPNTQNLQNPALNQSHEPFFFDRQLYTTFQVNEDGGSFINTTLNEPGEIWVTTIDSSQQTMWLVSDFNQTLNISEPEPFTGNDKIFVYYSANLIDPDNSPLNRIFQLRRCETPLNSTVTSIENLLKEKVKLYPNPTANFLNIELPSNTYEISIYGMDGSIHKQFGHSVKIDLSTYPDGVYFVFIEGNYFSVVRKVIKVE
jgi:hypothetical protein